MVAYNQSSRLDPPESNMWTAESNMWIDLTAHDVLRNGKPPLRKGKYLVFAERLIRNVNAAAKRTIAGTSERK